jgi:hypothetical protein
MRYNAVLYFLSKVFPISPLLYLIVFRNLQGFEGAPSNLAAIVTLASSVDYTTSNSSLKMLLPFVSENKLTDSDDAYD